MKIPYVIKFSRISILLLVITMMGKVHAQPCLTGWQYRVPIYLDNTGNASALTDYQVRIVVNTQDLVANDKAQLDGSDFRFLNATGTVLAHWVENDTYGSPNTVFWVKKANIPAASMDTLYMFYGNSSASDISSGDNTFELFDDFDGITVNTSKWNQCGAGNYSVSNGTLTLSSAAVANEQAILESVNLINSDVYIEADIVSVSNGQSFLGLKNNADNGFAMNYEINGMPVMLMREINSDGGGCFTLTDVQDPLNQNAQSANTTTGTWSFAWYGSEMQSYAWPGQPATETRNEDEHLKPAQYHAMIGHKNQGTLNGSPLAAGSIQLDWVRVRKYTDVEPTFSLGAETEINADVVASSNGPICEGEDLMLFATATPSATFLWSGPNGFSSTDQNPVITAATTAASGTYSVTATVPNNCQSKMATINVVVDSPTIAGTLSGAATVCSGNN